MIKPENENAPLRFGSPDDYARVVRALTEADYTEEAVCRTLALGKMSDLNSDLAQNADLSGTPARLALFIRLFLFFDPALRFEVELLLDRATINSFLALDILRPVDENASEYYTSVFLYPVADFYIASDRPVDLDGVVREPEDWVLPAIYEGTLNFLRMLPMSPSDEALDLCAGTGIGALVLSRSAGNAVAVDITPRARYYACFNRELNNLHNVEILEGDLYSAVAGRTFDRIIAHPPFVPTLRNQSIYRDGGETGEQLVRRIIEGLPKYLRAGGSYFGLSSNIDTRNAPFEERARRWLGEAQQDFDIVFARGEERSVESVINIITVRENISNPVDISRLRQAFEAITATRFVHGALVIRRRKPGERSVPCTLSTGMSATTTGVDLEMLLRSL